MVFSISNITGSEYETLLKYSAFFGTYTISSNTTNGGNNYYQFFDEHAGSAIWWCEERHGWLFGPIAEIGHCSSVTSDMVLGKINGSNFCVHEIDNWEYLPADDAAMMVKSLMKIECYLTGKHS